MKLSINGSVGNRGANHLKDVKRVQALLNVYLRRECRKELKADGKSGKNTAAAISGFQSHVVKMSKPDGNVGPHGRTLRALRAVLDGVYKDGLALIKPAIGLVTFNSEGHEGGFYHSRKLHVPGQWSGLTLGRGYDMGEKTASNIKIDLIKAGVSPIDALKKSGGHGLRYTVAKQFIINNDLLDFTITPIVQKALFLISYEEKLSEVKRISKVSFNVKNYGVVNWSKLDARIIDVVVDLCYRGDYHPKSRKIIQQSIVNNDFEAFKKVMNDKIYWVGSRKVPETRFNDRAAFLNK